MIELLVKENLYKENCFIIPIYKHVENGSLWWYQELVLRHWVGNLFGQHLDVCFGFVFMWMVLGTTWPKETYSISSYTEDAKRPCRNSSKAGTGHKA